MKYFHTLIFISILAGCDINSKSNEPVIIETPASTGTVKHMTHSNSSKPIFNHIALLVLDFQKSARFYKDVIGLDTLPNPFNDGKHIWFDIGEKNALHVIGGAASIMQHPRDNHICFSVKSVDSFIEKIQHEGISFEDARGKPNTITTRPDGIKQIYFKDPDGYWIEVNDAKR